MEYFMLTPATPPFSIALAPSFPGLRRFPQGRGFKQWTGDDSKALMKVNTIIMRSTPILTRFTGLPPFTGGPRAT